MAHKKVYGIYPVKSLQELKQDLEKDNIPSMDLEYEQLVQYDPTADWLGDIITGDEILSELKILFSSVGMEPEIYEIEAESYDANVNRLYDVVYAVKREDYKEFIRRELEEIMKSIKNIVASPRKDAVWKVYLSISEATVFFNHDTGGLYASYHMTDRFCILAEESVKFIAFPALQDYHC